ncbi:hypothetical protein APR04_003302 [Promicromonospora umidemergens]|uniref:Uncharacterized protein n=1 Tax=Promicromonospora umidemergens TaxID=629679 RepID=A0ABP8WEI8_9MICO|nr:hypothetical protein [Promicromonospora umidemergens]MCP2284381.1 hypothetical protein [Promicromonospora umidemergens]
MSAYAPAVRTAVPQPVGVPVAAAAAARRRSAAPGAGDRAAQRREIERAERQRAQADRVRDNQAARHPLALR